MSNYSILDLPGKKSNDVYCIHCGKSYKVRANLEKHLILCEITHSKKCKSEEGDDEMPSQKTMYKMIVELAQKYNRLEEKMNEVNKWVVKKKKKVDVKDWLNTTITPEYTFDHLIDKIHIHTADIEYLFVNNIYDTLSEIFSRTIYSFDEHCPLHAFIQKPNILYAFEGVWVELSRDRLILFLARVQMKISKVMFEWKQSHRADLHASDVLATVYDKATSKLMGTEFKADLTYSRIKNAMYSRLKTDAKTLIEYEFE